MAEAAPYVSTTNACKLCTPLGACLAFKGVAGAIPFLHGSQGCATYMRRYLISHFREPVDIASSSLGEKQAVFGGGPNLKQGLANVIRTYGPSLIGVATTCLTETIGDDVASIVAEFRRECDPGDLLPRIVRVATPSFQGSHVDGFHAAVRALVDQLSVAPGEHRAHTINLLPGIVSPADLRHLRALCAEFGLEATVLPDYADPLDGPAGGLYTPLAPGGTSCTEIESMGGNMATLELGRTLEGRDTAAAVLAERFGVARATVGLPVGLRETDRFLAELATLAGCPVPTRLSQERGRLVDAYVDGHKYLSGKRAVVYGEEDLVVGLAAFLAEIGVQPVLCATGAKSGRFAAAVEAVTADLVREPVTVVEGVDFHELAERAEPMRPELVVGSSKGYHLSRRWQVPLVRAGFPIHDRFGGQRTLHVGYAGALALYDRLVNAVLAQSQDASPVGYAYL